MATDPDSIDPDMPDPAGLADLLPDSDRGQGTLGGTTSDAIAQAAAEGVDLTDDGHGPGPRSTGTGVSKAQG
jgi:hypothetical protein